VEVGGKKLGEGMQKKGKNMDLRLFALCTIIWSASSISAQAAEIKLNGSRAITDVVFQLHLAEIQERTGHKILITENDSGNGVSDLANGMAQIAMTSKPLGKAVEDINKDSPVKVKSNGMQSQKVAEARISFAVHPTNAVKELTLKQVDDIFSGKIKNWSELGGADQPILVVMEKPGGPLRSLLTEELIKEKKIEATTREFLNVAQIPGFVEVTPNAIGVISSAYMTKNLAEITTDSPIKQDLYFVTKGTPSPEAQSVIDAVKAVSGIE
jgi:phosphate transport system substrate-binding protein